MKSRRMKAPPLLTTYKNVSEKVIEISDTIIYNNAVQSITNKILSRIYGKGRGWSFSQIDFIDIGTRDAVDQALSRLARRGSIRRLLPGLYDYPRYSELLQRAVAPDMQEVAQALARKRNWDIVPDEATSLQLLGIDTQVPARYRFLSSGPSTEYHILGTRLEFMHRKQQRTSIDDSFAATLVQALHALGEGAVTENERNHLASLRSCREYDRIVKNTRSVTSWVHEEIKRIAETAREVADS